MRLVLVICLASLVSTWSGYAQSQPGPAPTKAGDDKKGQATQDAEKPAAEERGTEKVPLVVNVLPAVKTQAEATQEAQDREEKTTNERLTVRFNYLLVLFNGLLAFFTIGLWWYTRKAAVAATVSANAATVSANAARDSADAAIKANAPFLHPRASRFNLYPVAAGATMPHLPAIWLNFENIGKTPAILRRMGIRFLLIENDRADQLPPPLADIPSVERNLVIAAQGVGGGRHWEREARISPDDIARLQAEAPQPGLLRIYLAGYAVYDDVFGMRHTRRFLLKVRQENNFQAIRGSEAHNRISREKTPEDEPAGVAPDEAAPEEAA